MKDEIIDEVRKNRDEFAARFNYDIDKLFEYLREQQKTSGRKYTSFSTKKAPAAKLEKTKKAA